MTCESCGTQLPWSMGPKRCRDCDNATRKLTEVGLLRAKLAAAEADKARAVEAAFREGWRLATGNSEAAAQGALNHAWLASEARRKVGV